MPADSTGDAATCLPPVSVKKKIEIGSPLLLRIREEISADITALAADYYRQNPSN